MPGRTALARGRTIGFSISFVSAARGKDLVATATVRRRGREISTGEVSVCDSDGREVAIALVTYKLSSAA
jgi:acyl-coenzyme A thioesterase PaaI-like protein